MANKNPGEGKYYKRIPQGNRSTPKGVEPREKVKANPYDAEASVINPGDAFMYSLPAMFGLFGKKDDKTSPTRLAKEMEKSDAKRAALKAARSRRKRVKK